ncbi:MAG TPA: hypothetical protein VF970_01355 [Gemmatimonadales bacterium]
MMTHSVSLSRRLVALFAVAFQLAGPAAVPVAEAFAQGGRTASHIESESAQPCPLGHNDRYCQLCRAVTLPASPAAASTIRLAPEPSIRRASAPERQARVTQASFSPLGARAPPSA